MFRLNKYRNKPCVVDGHRFPSHAEAKRYGQLQALRLATGALRVVEFHMQPKFLFSDGRQWTADFLVIWADGRVQVEDVKGFQTDKFKDQLKTFLAEFGLPVVILNGRPPKWKRVLHNEKYIGMPGRVDYLNGLIADGRLKLKGKIERVGGLAFDEKPQFG